MRPSELEGHRCAPRISPEQALHSGIRQRLARVAIDAGHGGNIYVNGERFSAAHFQFLIDNFQCPKPK